MGWQSELGWGLAPLRQMQAFYEKGAVRAARYNNQMLISGAQLVITEHPVQVVQLENGEQGIPSWIIIRRGGGSNAFYLSTLDLPPLKRVPLPLKGSEIGSHPPCPHPQIFSGPQFWEISVKMCQPPPPPP